MIIYVNGQDIAQLVLGMLGDWGRKTWLQEPQIFSVRPEQYLSTLETWLTQSGISKAQITGFVLIKGPGSATALRASHAMVNALAFALGVKVISLELSPASEDKDIMAQLSLHVPHAFALPVYAHGPNITQTKRDPLKRKLT